MIDDGLQAIHYAIKATHGDLCANQSCFRRITEGTVCPECDKQRHDDEIDRIKEEITCEMEEDDGD